MSEKYAARDRRGVWLAIGGLVTLLGALYLASWFFFGATVPAGTRVAGVDIGGLSPDEAVERLESELADETDEPIQVAWNRHRFKVDPKRAGLTFDAEATVHEAGGGRSWNPLHTAESLFGHGATDPVIRVDRKALEAAVARIARRVDIAPTEPSVTFTATGQRRPHPPKEGRAVDREAAAAEIVETFLDDDDSVRLLVRDVPPTIGARGLAQALDRIAKPAVSGPVRLRLPGRTVELRVAEFAPALRVRVVDGAMAPRFDVKRLAGGLSKLTTRIGADPRNARLELRGGRPVVVPSTSGRAIDAREVANAVPPVLTKSGKARSVQVGTSVRRAAFTTKEAKALGVRRVVSRFTTYYPHARYRNVNLRRAARLVNGTVLRPGKTFSLNRALGRRTAANGFTVGYVIRNGKLDRDHGGGVSQLAATLFNAAFFAGLKDVQHRPHHFYIDRYPAGREATVRWPGVDLRFKNTTPYAVMIQTWIEPSRKSRAGRMHVRMWSTKYWDITASRSKRHNIRKPGVRRDRSRDCVRISGKRGFDITVYRYFRRHGSDKLHHKEKMTARYAALDRVRCQRPRGRDRSRGRRG